jgi:hypothetical protein
MYRPCPTGGAGCCCLAAVRHIASLNLHEVLSLLTTSVVIVTCLPCCQADYDRRPNSILVYAPSRTCAVYGPAEWADAEADRKPAGVPGLAVKELGPYYEY